MIAPSAVGCKRWLAASQVLSEPSPRSFKKHKSDERHSEGETKGAPEREERHSNVAPTDPPSPEQIHQRARAYWREDKAHSWNYAVGKYVTPQYQQADRACHRAHQNGACRTAHSR